jgi:hypothetical protein
MSTMDAHVNRMVKQLELWGAMIDGLSLAADDAGTVTKFDYLQRIAALKMKQRIAQVKIDELKLVGIEHWEEYRIGIETAWSDLDDAIRVEYLAKHTSNVAKIEMKVANVEAQLHAWSLQLEEIVKGFSVKGIKSRDPYHVHIDSLRMRHAKVQTKLDEFNHPAENCELWKTFSATIADDWNTLDEGLKDLKP